MIQREEFMDIRLLEKFFQKECTPEEALEVMKWFRDREVRSEHEAGLMDAWKAAEKEKIDLRFSHDSEEVLANIHRQIKAESKDSRHPGQRVYPQMYSRAHWMQAAAVLFVGVLLAWLLVDPIEKEQTEKVPEVISLEAPRGIKLTKVLPDGSKVTLNSNSSISYTEGFTESKREITLKGEAFFQVTKDPARPFIVHTGDIATTALGTSFNVRHHESDSISEISLVTGKVRLGIQGKEEVKITSLLPGERATYQSATDSLQVDQFDVQEVLAWKDGVLYFKEAGFKQVVRRLEDWYGVKITPQGNFARTRSSNWTYTGRFENESLDNVLTGIGFVKDFNYEINGKDVKLLFN